MKKWFSDFFNQLWTILGMFTAWVVLEGSAKTIVGYAIMVTLVVWAVTLNIRNMKDE